MVERIFLTAKKKRSGVQFAYSKETGRSMNLIKLPDLFLIHGSFPVNLKIAM